LPRLGAPGDVTLTAEQAFAEEAQLERVAVTARKWPYVRFDLNDYSIHVRRPLTVLANLHEARVLFFRPRPGCERGPRFARAYRSCAGGRR
jgi:hypothetical protein